MKYKITDLPDRVQEKIEEDTNGCWNWKRYLDRYGYGQVQWIETQKSHQAVYRILVGEMPEGLVLDHLCRNRACCNPEHLDPVTNQVNTQRGNVAVLNAQVVLQMREMYEQGNVTVQDVADKFGFIHTTVSDALRGRTWTNVGGYTIPTKRSHKLTNEQKNQVLNMYDEGYTQAEIVSMFGVHQTSISYLIRTKRGNEKRKRKQPNNVYPSNP